ncbi:MAG: pyridoxamine 5'-phosphate oxidase family protein [Armatimonadota bacterium]|nr:pyridoxamine 5'-phosphate oxidase family protein [Armatimonadota bacterium]MDR5696371.1 pyridoxamine 5'-phosphate oxidase family protein [Armatimonadota bacterium]
MRADQAAEPISVAGPSRGMSVADPRRAAEVFWRLLEENRIMTLATASGEGPWAAPVLYAWEAGPVLYFMSRLGTRHVQDALVTGRAAAAIHPNETRPLRGIQLAGSVERLRGERARHAIDLYLDRFPAARGRFPVEDVLAERGDIRFFALRPDRAFVLSEADFGWGVREEVRFDG